MSQPPRYYGENHLHYLTSNGSPAMRLTGNVPLRGTADTTRRVSAPPAWNAEGKTATVAPWGGTATAYVYDGDGHRVEDTSAQRRYWYGAGAEDLRDTGGGTCGKGALAGEPAAEGEG